MYDAIVVGARCAGSPTAMLLARRGYRVLLVDRATFPSDRLSTHYIQPSGVEQLARWGLLDAVSATNCPPIHQFQLYFGGALVFAAPQDPSAYCPRRHLLDKMLVDAAVAEGAELREAFTVDGLLFDDGRVTGVAGHGRGGARVTEEARVVIGAEGHHSVVADAVGASKYHEREPLTGGYYTYWTGVDVREAEVHITEQGGTLAFPTNDGAVCIAAGRPAADFKAYRSNIEGTYMEIIDASPELAARVRRGRRAERFLGTIDVPNFFRKPGGPGWALVGDAGYMKDPITGMGISDAFRDAELLADALHDAWSGAASEEEALADYQQKRDTVALPMYNFTLALAAGDMEAIATMMAAAAGGPAAPPA